VTREIVVSVDGMGGDNAPQSVIDGLAIAHIRHPKAKFLLHGDHARLQSILPTRPALKNVAQIVHCDDVVGMDDKPSQALRRGRQYLDVARDRIRSATRMRRSWSVPATPVR
jgi:glycerol-3-phosphate acyltransferase PlsX